MIELWKPVVGFEGRYQISSLGRVRSTKVVRLGGNILTPQDNGNGRKFVRLFVNGVGYKRYPYKLVAEAFLGPAEGRMVLHWDDIGSNDCLSNLRYGTSKENGSDMVRNGNSTRGKKNSQCKLKESQVLEIRELLRQKIPQTKIASLFGIHQMTVSDINTGRIWRWL
jgi:predicted XRE-type DNA-binding protein